MYPSIVDMNENESSKCLRMLELDAYANILAALRAQGPPTSDKLKLLKEIGTTLRIPHERCKAEIRKVILDERLNTIAYFSCGQLETADEWIKEGRRLISLMPRVAPQTIYSAIADEVADAASISNEQLPLPALTDRKRSTSVSQVQPNVPESIKSQQFRVPDAFKSEESKKRKLAFGVENSTLAQHLISPYKNSRIQQIYRQKPKSKVKEQQLSTKIKQQDQDHESRHTQQQSRVLQQHFPPRIQKLAVSTQPSTSSSPKINILQNISIQPPNRTEETIEQIKNEVNNFIVQKTSDPNRTSPQPGCSNENQAPKQQKPTVINIKPNSNITYKHVASPGPSSELQKSLKVCSTRKPVTKTVPGQKLIIVSNAQSIATSSILQRTLTIPFVKNISVKNFDKFKIVSTSTNTSNLQLTSLANANTNTFTTNSAKHKVVTVRTNPNSAKKVIPIAHLTAFNTKGIKVLPVGGKLLTKPTTGATSPLFIFNNASGSQPALTQSTSSTSLTMTSRPQDAVIISEPGTALLPAKGEDSVFKSTESSEASTESTNCASNLAASSNSKSSVLADILKAAGVIASENEAFGDDIESQISKLTAIPQSASCGIMTGHASREFEPIEDYETEEEHEDEENCQNNGSTYFLLGKDQETDRLLKDLEGEDSTDTVIGSLDPGTGEYTIETSVSHCEDEAESNALSDDTYLVEVQKPTNMPDINAVN